jgi:hypothetical protein
MLNGAARSGMSSRAHTRELFAVYERPKLLKWHRLSCATIEFRKSNADSIRSPVIGQNEETLNFCLSFGHEYASVHVFRDHRDVWVLVHQFNGTTHTCDPPVVAARHGGKQRARKCQ